MNHPNELDQQLDNLRTLQQSYDAIAAEVSSSKQAIIHEMQLSGLDIDDNASMAEVAERMREYTLLVRGNTEFVEGTYIRSLGDAIFDGLMSKELVSIETELPIAINQSWMSQANNIELKRFVAPNATSMNPAYLSGCTSLRVLDCPLYTFGSSIPGVFPVAEYINAKVFDKYSYSGHLKYLECHGWYQVLLNSNYDGIGHLIIETFYNNGSFGTHVSSANVLYDFRFTIVRSANTDLAGWCKSGVNMAGENMVLQTDYDDPDQPHFANNGEKILWYFKRHFLYMDDGTPTFADMSETTAPTLTLGANLRDLVMADDEVAAYFTERNWIVA